MISAEGPEPLEYSIAWLICSVTCDLEAVFVTGITRVPLAAAPAAQGVTGPRRRLAAVPSDDAGPQQRAEQHQAGD